MASAYPLGARQWIWDSKQRKGKWADRLLHQSCMREPTGWAYCGSKAGRLWSHLNAVLRPFSASFRKIGNIIHLTSSPSQKPFSHIHVHLPSPELFHLFSPLGCYACQSRWQDNKQEKKVTGSSAGEFSKRFICPKVFFFSFKSSGGIIKGYCAPAFGILIL